MPTKTRIQNVTSLNRETGELTLYGEVGAYYGGISPDRFAEMLAEAKGDTLTIYLNSIGGDVFDAMAIVAQLKRVKKTKVCCIDGVAASAATLIAMAADRIVMAPGSMLMIHMPFVPCTGGGADELRSRAEALDQITESVVALYAERTGQMPEQIREWMAAETWMNAQTALERGFCDAVEGVESPDTDDADLYDDGLGLVDPARMSADLFKRFKRAPSRAFALLGKLPPTNRAAQGGKEKTMNKVMMALGLAEGSNESQAVERIAALCALEKQVFDLSAKSSPSEALGVLAAHRAAAEQVQSLSARVNELETAQRAAEVDRIVNALKTDGKLVPAQETWARELGAKDLVQLQAFAASAPVIVAMKSGVREPAPNKGALKPFAEMSADEKAVLAAEDPELYAKLRSEN